MPFPEYSPSFNEWLVRLQSLNLAPMMQGLVDADLSDTDFRESIFDLIMEQSGAASSVNPFYLQRMKRNLPITMNMGILDYLLGNNEVPTVDKMPSILASQFGGNSSPYAGGMDKLSRLAGLAEQASSSQAVDPTSLFLRSPEFYSKVAPSLHTAMVGNQYSPLIASVIVPELKNQYRQWSLFSKEPWWELMKRMGVYKPTTMTMPSQTMIGP